MHEIVTLQFGQQSNYLATHFWNTQESYFTYGGQEESPVDHDVHFRAGIGADGSDTFTPRTVIYDLKGGFGSMRKINALYELEEDLDIRRGLWDGRTLVQRQPPVQQNQYQQHLDLGLPPPPLASDSVRYWSDFNRVFYHPRSIVQLNEYELQSSTQSFNRWEVGEELFSSLDKEHDLLDRDVRPFIEECDQLQGMQLLTGGDDAWGGFCARYLDRLRDEFGKSSIWVWAQETTSTSTREQRLKIANRARSIYEISSQASVYVPMSNTPAHLPSYINLDVGSPWHTTALQACALESVALPTRLRVSHSQRATLDEMETILNKNGNRKITRLQLSIGKEAFGFGAHGHRDQEVDQDFPDSDMDFFGQRLEQHQEQTNGWHAAQTFGVVECTRENGTSTPPSDLMDIDGPGNRHAQRPGVQRYRTSLLFPMLDSYPRILTHEGGPSSSVAVQASVSTSSTVAERIRTIGHAARRFIDIDEREALSNGIEEICEAYTEGQDSDINSDDDDL